MEVNDNLRLIILDNCKEFGQKVNDNINDIMKNSEYKNYIVPVSVPRFSNGEGKGVLLESIRGKDVYIISDVGNHSCTYEMHGYINHMSPDDHYQDIKRVIGAIMGHAKSIMVAMPLLYESRQHKRKGRESLDCAIMLQELIQAGAKGVITFDAHHPGVNNAIPYNTFDNIYPTNMILNNFIDSEDIDFRKLLVISPDEGAVSRARYNADMLRSDVGLFYKRRDYSKIVDGKNPIVAHDYLGKDVKGLNALIVDDMIASGETMLDVARRLKERGAENIYISVTFALFTEGIEEFRKAYKQGLFYKVYTTNLSHINEEFRKEEWLNIVDCSRLLAKYIYTVNQKKSTENLANGKQKILKKLEEKDTNFHSND